MGTLAALAAAAFALGAGAGLLWKDPGLLVAQWMGDTQEVAWSADAQHPAEEILGSASGPLPAVEVPSRDAAQATRAPAQEPAKAPAASYRTAAAEPVRPVAAATPAPPPAPTPSVALKEDARAQTPPVSAPPPPHGLAVQVGAFGERRAADQLIAKLRKQGFPAYASAADGGAWRVRVGPYRDRSGAEQAAARLKRDQKLPTWVLEESAGR